MPGAFPSCDNLKSTSWHFQVYPGGQGCPAENRCSGLCPDGGLLGQRAFALSYFVLCCLGALCGAIPQRVVPEHPCFRDSFAEKPGPLVHMVTPSLEGRSLARFGTKD